MPLNASAENINESTRIRFNLIHAGLAFAEYETCCFCRVETIQKNTNNIITTREFIANLF